MRKLASIQKIEELRPIENADKIEVATILGWNVVVKKGEFNIGDSVVYIEIDSILPPKKEFEFLKERGYKVKTIKLRKQISQGIAFPLSILNPNEEYHVGDDVTEMIGVKKTLSKDEREELKQQDIRCNRISKYMKKYSWYRKLFIQKRTTKGFPKFIKKTDETRIQNIKNILESDESFIVTEKLDGSSGTFILLKNDLNIFQKLLRFKKYEFIVCSRNMRKGLKNDSSSWWKVAKKYNIEEKLKTIIGTNKYIGLQGEVLGYNIQGNKYKLPPNTYDFYAFNYITPEKTYSAYSIKNVLSRLGIKTVPLLDDNYKLPKTVDEIVEYSIGKSQLYDTNREGIVVRNKDNIVSFKVINPKFLLKHGE